MADILVLAEMVDGELQNSAKELFQAAGKLSNQTGNIVSAILMGPNAITQSEIAIQFGAQKVYTMTNSEFDSGNLDYYMSALLNINEIVKPSAILCSKTPLGKEVAPRLAYRLGVGVAQDCLDVTADHKTGRVTVTRPVYGGNAIAKFKFSNNDPQIIIIRENIFEPLSQDMNRTGKVTNLNFDLKTVELKSRLIETVKEPKEGVQLDEARVVIGGGRGLGGPEPFEQLEELARLFGGAVGASRAVCDAGWLDHSYQIGLTGKTVAPDLYITIGISGASQHMAGCSASKTIVAINRDPDANIFKTADYGVVGDWEQILPTFTEAVRDLLAE